MHRTTVDTNDIFVCVCLGFACVVSGGRGKKPGNLRLSRRCSGPRVPCDRKLGSRNGWRRAPPASSGWRKKGGLAAACEAATGDRQGPDADGAVVARHRARLSVGAQETVQNVGVIMLASETDAGIQRSVAMIAIESAC